MSAIEFIDQTLRDGPQSLWGMRINPSMILPVADTLDTAGFHTIDFSGGNLMAVLTRGMREDPWEGLRRVTTAFPKTPLRAAVRADGITMVPASTELMVLWVETLASHGIKSIWIFDVLLNLDRVAPLVKAAKNVGLEVLGSIMWTNSPHHTDEYYQRNVRALAKLGIDAFYFEDAAGCLTPDRARTLMPVIIEAAGGLDVEMHVHNTTGLAPACYMEGLRAGIRKIHTAIPPLADGGSLPSLNTMLTNTRVLGYEDSIRDSSLQSVSDHFNFVADVEGYAKGSIPDYDVRVYDHQMPGGMMGTLKVQLAQLNLQDRLGEVLEETGKVRRELGFPGMATPFSQFVGTQAVMNMITQDRYQTVSDEIILYMQGYYGDIVGPIDQNIKDRILDRPRARELEGFEPVQSVAELRRLYGKDISDGELILRASMPGAEVDAMRSASPKRDEYGTPFVALVERLLKVEKNGFLQCNSGDLSVTLVKQSELVA